MENSKASSIEDLLDICNNRKATVWQGTESLPPHVTGSEKKRQWVSSKCRFDMGVISKMIIPSSN